MCIMWWLLIWFSLQLICCTFTNICPNLPLPAHNNTCQHEPATCWLFTRYTCGASKLIPACKLFHRLHGTCGWTRLVQTSSFSAPCSINFSKDFSKDYLGGEVKNIIPVILFCCDYLFVAFIFAQNQAYALNYII